jgi:hypothetical protein
VRAAAAFAGLALAAGATHALGGSGGGSGKRLVVPPGGLYHGIHPGGASGLEDRIDAADLDAYERAVGRRAAWVYFSSEWSSSRAFPRATAEWIRARGSVPFVRLMLRSSLDTNVREPLFTLEAIARGDFDDDLRAWADGARAYGSPVVVEWGTEENGDWFPWSARWSNDASRSGFRSAYRHVVEVMRSRANLITWVFHINAPDAAGERFERAWPGADVVDWVALSCYGAQTPQDTHWDDFVRLLDEYVPRIEAMAPGAPIVVAEMGADVRNASGDAVRWADQAFGALVGGRWPSVRGFSWWSEHWENDGNPSHDSEMRVVRAPALAAAMRARLASPKVVERPVEQ